MNLEIEGGRRGVPLENEKLKDLQRMARGIYHLSPNEILGKTKTELINAIRKKKGNKKVKVRKDEYDGLTNKKLKEILKKRKIKGYSKLNKKGLLHLVRNEPIESKKESFVSFEIIKSKPKIKSGKQEVEDINIENPYGNLPNLENIQISNQYGRIPHIESWVNSNPYGRIPHQSTMKETWNPKSKSKSKSTVSIEFFDKEGNPAYYQKGDIVKGVRNTYKILQKLGEGGFGVSYKIEDLKTKKLYALKTEDIEDLKKEITILKKIGSLIDVVKKPIKGLVYAYAEGFPLNFVAPLSEKDCLVMYEEIKKQLDFIHSKNIFHRDITPNNIIFDMNQNKFVLIDFGLSIHLEKDSILNTKPPAGTPYYTYPELYYTKILNKDILTKADFWSLGACLYFLYTDTKPPKNFNIAEIQDFSKEAPELWKIVYKLLKL